MQQILYRVAIWVILLTGTGTLKAQDNDKSKAEAKGEKKEKQEKDEKKPMLSKEVSIETNCAANATVFIQNIYRNIHIKTSADNKVRLVTTAFYTEENDLTNAQWMEKLNIELKGSGNMIVVKSGNVNTGANVFSLNTNYNYAVAGTGQAVRTKVSAASPTPPAVMVTGKGDKRVAVLDGLGSMRDVKTNAKRDITIYIPGGAKIDVESKYADVDLTNDIGELKAKLTNASINMANAKKAIIISTYGNVITGNIDDAQLELTNGRLRAKNIAKLDIDTKYSSVELGNLGDVFIRSVNDQYEIDQANHLKGRKSYGNLRITSLVNSLEIEGSNADIKIRSLESTVSLVKIDNKYADIRLPVNNLKNFAVNFDGQYSSVYAPFEKVAVNETTTPEPTKTGSEKKPAKAENTFSVYEGTVLYGSGGNWGEGKDSKFTATVGNTSGSHTSFQLKCVNCTVDFK